MMDSITVNQKMLEHLKKNFYINKDLQKKRESNFLFGHILDIPIIIDDDLFDNVIKIKDGKKEKIIICENLKFD